MQSNFTNKILSTLGKSGCPVKLVKQIHLPKFCFVLCKSAMQSIFVVHLKMYKDVTPGLGDLHEVTKESDYTESMNLH